MSEVRTRAPVFAGNWKMHKGPRDAVNFFARFTEAYAAREDRTVIFFPPAVSIEAAARALRQRTDVRLGVQNIHWEPTGAFTGETGGPMAFQAGAHYALAGHSERRHGMGEDDATVARKTRAALDAGISPVVCVGETLDERRAGQLERVLSRQLGTVLDALAGDPRLARVLLAYEPVWAIGTGVVATPDDAAAAHGFLRVLLREKLGVHAGGLPILYGGSVKPDNAADLLNAKDVDGLLVGGASLDPDGFANIASVDTVRAPGDL
jgi:triosephosphate isomerase